MPLQEQRVIYKLATGSISHGQLPSLRSMTAEAFRGISKRIGRDWKSSKLGLVTMTAVMMGMMEMLHLQGEAKGHRVERGGMLGSGRPPQKRRQGRPSCAVVDKRRASPRRFQLHLRSDVISSSPTMSPGPFPKLPLVPFQDRQMFFSVLSLLYHHRLQR